MRRARTLATLSFAFTLSCAGSREPVPEPPPRPPPAIDEPGPASSDEDASTAREELAEVDDEDPRGDPLATDPDAGEVYGPTTSGPGRLDPVVIQRVVRQNTSRIRSCYVAALAKDPDATASIRVAFVIGDTGAVTAASLERASQLPDLDRCVAAAVLRMKFPAPDGGSVMVRLPFVFAPAG